MKERLRRPGYFLAPLLETVLAIHAGALVHVGLRDVVASAGGYPLLNAFADKAPHQKGAAPYASVGLGVPGDPLLGQPTPLLFRSARTHILPQRLRRSVSAPTTAGRGPVPLLPGYRGRDASSARPRPALRSGRRRPCPPRRAMIPVPRTATLGLSVISLHSPSDRQVRPNLT